MRDRLRLAVIGVGMMGKNHLRVYSKMKNVKIQAVCDINENLGKSVAKEFDAIYYNDVKDLLENEKIDAVSIVTPTIYHAVVSLECIKRRIPILVEKPLASNSLEVKKIIDAAKQKNVLICVGHIERFNPAIQNLKKLMDKKIFGKVLSVNIKRVGLYPQRRIETDVISDLAVHDLDIVTYLLGSLPISVFAKGGSTRNNGLYDHVEIFLNYGEFGCFIQTNWMTPIKIRTLSLTGSKSYAELNYMTQDLALYNNTIIKAKDPILFDEFIDIYGKPKKRMISFKKKEPLIIEIQNFVEAVLHNKHFMATGEAGLQAVVLTESVRKSITSGKIVML